MSIARCRSVVGSLYGLMRNALGLNVATPLESQELSCTVSPDRRLVVLGHEPIAGFARDHGTVADEAAMLALHTLDSATLLAEPTFVAPGDSVLRADDPGWRWHCISGHGQSLSDWERRPLGGALEGLATSGHTHAISGVTGLQTALDGKQAALSNSATLAKIGEADGNPTWNGSAWPGGGGRDIGDLLVFDWRVRVERSGGGLTTDSLTYAADLIAALRTAGLLPKIMRLDAWLGADLTAATTPLIDRLNRGTTLFGMLESHFSEVSGLTFDATNYLSSRYYPSELGLSNNGGLGWWEAVATDTGNVEPIGSSDGGSSRYLIDLRSGAPGGFRWGSSVNVTQPGPGRAAAHYYGQRSSATSRVLYRDGVSIATNTTSDSASGASAAPIALGASNYAGMYYPWTGRCKLAYLTRGTLTADEVATLHTALAGWMSAVGRT